ncbi:MAG: hypothetical protein KGL39_16890, partial [Patescibacteria group bacterium]|nr:hypothetical protein [Patescibacteria group bacterium]
AFSAVDGGTGYCTQGTHLIGFVYQNRTGYGGIPVTGTSYPITATTKVQFSVTATSNANPDVLTVPGHTFTDGQTVTGSGATGDTAINGVFFVANAVAGTSLQLTDQNGNPIAGNGAYTGGGILTAPDLITAPGNNIQSGETVTIAGATGDTAINVGGTAFVVTAGSTFWLTDSNGNPVNNSGAYTGGGMVTNPFQINLTAGNRQINISVTLPAQSDGGTSNGGTVQATLFLIATRSDNPALWYFIPDDSQTGQIGEQPVPYNQQVTLSFVFSLSDEDIASSLAGDTAQQNFLFTAQNPDGTGPFNPSFVVAYGNRMCYGDGTTLWVSDLGFPQQIAADTNQVRMQSQRKIAMAFPLPGNTGLYLTGDGFTGYVTDNGDSPSTWAVPIIVSGASGDAVGLGTTYPNCVCASTKGPYVWIVTPSGPYLFDGAFEGNQLLYLSSGYDEQQNPTGWTRVNWAAAYAIQIRDDIENLKLYIAAPLDGATECNYMFVIDYRMGYTFDSVDVSIDVFNPQLFSSIAVVKEQATGKRNLWIGPAAAGNVARFDVTTPNDQGNAINSYWVSGLVRGLGQIQTAMIRVGAMDIWARGNAPLDASGNPTFLITLIGPDGVQQVPVVMEVTQGVPAALVETPGLQYQAQCDLSQVENVYCSFGTNAVGAFWELSGFTLFIRGDLSNR